MNKALVKIIILLLAVSLLGLALIQVKLIKQGINSREQQFDQSVYDALNRTAVHLEQIYTMKKVNASMNSQYVPRARHQGVFSNMFKNAAALDLYLKHNGVYKFKDSLSGSDINIVVDSQQNYHSIEFQSNHSLFTNAIMEELFEKSVSSLLGDVDPIESFVSQQELEGLLRDELKLSGIHTDFQFSLIQPTTYTTIYTNINELTPAIYEKSYQRPVFSNNFFGNEWLLLVYFPKKETYILSSLWLLLSASTLFVCIILFCFGVSIFIIFRQKKLGDLKTDFINNMTHELKTPVATISLAGEMLKNPRVLSDPDKASNYASIILEENNRLSNHIERVLQFAKYDKGQIELKKEYFDLHELIRNTEQIVHLRVQNDKGELNLHLNAKEHSILADKHHVESVISNIIDNAIKYRKEVPIIDIYTEDAAGGVKIIIADQGIGMSKDIQKKIFEKFYRVSTGNLHDVKGFGLGLSYVKAIIDAHKGRIEVSSELGKGSRFEIFFPTSNNQSKTTDKQ